MRDAMLNQTAPAFSLPDQNDTLHSPSDYRGRWCVIYFYPKDDTPGCTKQACNLRDNYAVLVDKNIQIIGISCDKEQNHQQFADKYQLPFTLLSDAQGTTARQYQCLFSLGPIKFAKRHSFLIDPEGIIRATFRNVQAGQHSQQILDAFERLTLC
jgi:peroxiredoxin Q/BCP